MQRREGIRGAVGSQMESRIGANPMQRMYGAMSPAAKSPPSIRRNPHRSR